jgi:hypothetical protein
VLLEHGERGRRHCAEPLLPWRTGLVVVDDLTDDLLGRIESRSMPRASACSMASATIA